MSWFLTIVGLLFIVASAVLGVVGNDAGVWCALVGVALGCVGVFIYCVERQL